MDIELTREQQVFRTEVCEFLQSNLPETLRRKVDAGSKISRREHAQWQAILAQKGWLAPSWPQEWGGTGWGVVERFIFDEEAHKASMPRANLAGIDLLGPVIVEFGTQEQKRRYLPRILSGEDWWCQGFSEPGAGSDLAALSMRASRDGDCYVVNGTKLWTSYAQDADWIFCLVRTSIEERKQAGISFLLIPMTLPGISVSPIITLAGVHSVNQVIIDGVRVPIENRVGEEGRGWEITRFLLSHERVVGAWIGLSARLLDDLKQTVYSDPGIDVHYRERVAALEIELMALRYTAYRVLADQETGRAPGPQVSVLKLRGSELQQRLAELFMELAGALAFIDPTSLSDADCERFPSDLLYRSRQYLDRRKMTIYGGSAEIQRNIIAQSLLRR